MKHVFLLGGLFLSELYIISFESNKLSVIKICFNSAHHKLRFVRLCLITFGRKYQFTISYFPFFDWLTVKFFRAASIERKIKNKRIETQEYECKVIEYLHDWNFTPIILERFPFSPYINYSYITALLTLF